LNTRRGLLSLGGGVGGGLRAGGPPEGVGLGCACGVEEGTAGLALGVGGFPRGEMLVVGVAPG